MPETLAVSLVQAQGVGTAISDTFRDVVRAVVLVVPKLAAFLVILIIGWLIAWGLRALVNKVLQRVRFDRVGERGGLGRMLARTRFNARDLVAKLVYYAVLLLALRMAFAVWGPNPVSNLIDAILAFLPKAVVAVIIVVVAAAIAEAVRDLVAGALQGVSYGRFLARLIWVFILALGVIAALNQIGVATTVTTPVLIAVLATLGATFAIGVGGGLVQPMQQRWEGWLRRVEQETPQLKAQAEAYQRGREDARRAAAEAAEKTGPASGTEQTTKAAPGDQPTQQY
jgi:hypothetical protein